MSFSLSGYSENYAENEYRDTPSSPNSWGEKVFEPSEARAEKRIFTPSETVDNIIKEWDKRLSQADEKAEKWFDTNFFFVALWPDLLDEMDSLYEKNRNTTHLTENECWLNALNEVIKNHPEKNLKDREQELTMGLMKELLLKKYGKLKDTIKKQKELFQLMGYNDTI